MTAKYSSLMLFSAAVLVLGLVLVGCSTNVATSDQILNPPDNQNATTITTTFEQPSNGTSTTPATVTDSSPNTESGKY